MHELSIAMAIIERAEQVAREHNASAVEAVLLRVGALAGVVPDALRFSFDVARAGTALAGATLEIEQEPARAWCHACAAEFAVGTPEWLRCPRCDHAATELLAGRELLVTGVRLSHQSEESGCGHVRAG